MAGRPRKAPNAIAGHRAPRQGLRALPAAEPEEREPPPPLPTKPRGRRWLLKAVTAWERFWLSELADHIDRNADLYRVERWIRDVDELERAWGLWEEQRIVTGSMGQLRTNPIWKVIESCEQRLAKAEEQLGMTPLARARLGLTLGQAASAIDEMNRRMNESDEPPGPRPAGQTIEGDWKAL